MGLRPLDRRVCSGEYCGACAGQLPTSDQLIFFVLAPGVVAFLVPFLMAQGQREEWRLDPPVIKWAGLALGIAERSP